LNKNQSEKMHRISFPKINNSPIPVDYSEIDTDVILYYKESLDLR